MKAFHFCIPLVFLAVLPEINPLFETPIEDSQVEQILTANPWKQVAFTVYPALVIDEEAGITAKDLFVLQDEETQNRIVRFDAEGNYQIALGESAMADNMMFAARSGSADDSDQKPIQADEAPSGEPTVNILETGSWMMNDGNLVLISDNGRMKEEVLKVRKADHDKMIVSFTRIIDGEEHSFTQVFESQPFIDLGW
jgi:hypothetical protein